MTQILSQGGTQFINKKRIVHQLDLIPGQVITVLPFGWEVLEGFGKPFCGVLVHHLQTITYNSAEDWTCWPWLRLSSCQTRRSPKGPGRASTEGVVTQWTPTPRKYRGCFGWCGTCVVVLQKHVPCPFARTALLNAPSVAALWQSHSTGRCW